ncbi:MAG: asparagine synthase (glutamine-hydrolyzing) [Arenimonas sp.]
MCGIVGGWTLQHFQQLSERLPVMTAALTHRGPDAEGCWLDGPSGIAFGHRRLAILGLGAEGAQPMQSEGGRYCLTYNGEIYNHLELRRELATSGKSAWRGQSDTETLLACFEQFGIEDTIRRCVGMFAMAVWDGERNELILVRDRMGEKPLYYGYIDGAFLFGSELRALTAFSGRKPDFNRDAFALFLRYGYIPQPYSAYNGIAKLPAGALLRMDAGHVSQRRSPAPYIYWNPEDYLPDADAAPVRADEAVSRLESLLDRAVAGQMLSEVPLGAFLSGGVDSSAIAALMQKHSSHPIKTFTVGFESAQFNEAGYAKAVAAHLGTEHTELYVTSQDALAVVPKLAGIYDEPFSDSSQIPTYLISQLARTKVTVSLSGDGGDELFLGYSRYPLLADYWRVMGKIPVALRRTISDCLKWLPMGRWDDFFTLAKPLLSRTAYASANGWRLYKIANMLRLSDASGCYLEMMSHWDTDARLIAGAVTPRHEMQSEFCPRANGLMKQAALRDMRSYLPDDILVKVDRAAMANSLETRVPLLDHRIAEYALSLPQELHRREGQSKWLLRQVLYKHVPRTLIDRPKMGFGVPLAEWLRGPLREWAGDLLSKQNLAGHDMLAAAPIMDLWQRHQSGTTDGHYPLWNVLMLLQWLETEK